MSILFSRGCEYALQSMLYLASQPSDTPIFQRDISDALSIPQHFLGKVLQSLSKSMLVVSQKGKAGGFSLGRSAKDITLYEVIQVVDGPVFLEGCILGFSGCTDEASCPVGPEWKEIKRQIVNMLQSKDIEELSRELDPKLASMQKILSQHKV